VVSTCKSSPFSFRFRGSRDLKLFGPAGNSLPRLTMNGGLFGAIFPTGTLYGSVTMGGSASPESRVDLLIQQIYSLTRVACLLGVIICTYGLDVTTSINCQVSTVF
jgi:hypothetical protein